MSVLVVAEHLRGEMRDVTWEMVSAASQLGRPVSVVVIGRDPMALDSSREGVDEIIHVRVDQEEFEGDVYRSVLEALILARSPEIVLAPFSVNGMGFAPAVAASLETGFASDVFGLARENGTIVATRAFYGSKVHAEIEFPSGRPVILLLRPTIWPLAAPGGTPSISEVAPPSLISRAKHVEFVEAKRSDVDITVADFLLSIGRGVGTLEGVGVFAELAAKLGATLSASRPLVDAGWVPSARQVGQSGKTVNPRVYLAFGISGAVQHLAGMSASETIIAVNTDPDAAIFDVAHYGAVVDLFEVADELAKLA